VINPLDSTNPHGIRVVADRAPVREDIKVAFAEGSRKATVGIDKLIGPRSRRRGSGAPARRSK